MRLLVFITALSLLAGCSKKPDAAGGGAGRGAPVPVNVGGAVKKDRPVDLRAIGNVESMATVEVKAQVGGELFEVNFKEGQDVKKGDLLFTLQPLLYETLLAQAQANLVKDRVQAENARRAAERNSALGTKGAISPEQLDQMRAVAEAAEAAVKADEALVKIARVRLGYATIESSINGRTGAVHVQPGNLIKDNADTAMTTIKQMAPIYVTFAVPEQHLADIRRGLAERALPVTALNPKSGHALARGTVTFIANAVDMTTGTITLKATFPTDDRALWPGAGVDGVLRLDTETGVTVVPSSAVTMGQQGPQVFVVKAAGVADLRSVTVGRTGGVGSVFATTTLPDPYGLAFDSAGNLYVSNYGNNTIQQFSSTGTDLGVFADSSDGLNGPVGLAFGAVPEPTSALVLLGSGALLLLRRRRPVV